jgi:hypothetical protein
MGGTTDAAAFVPSGMNAVFILTSPQPFPNRRGSQEKRCSRPLSFIRLEESPIDDLRHLHLRQVQVFSIDDLRLTIDPWI